MDNVWMPETEKTVNQRRTSVTQDPEHRLYPRWRRGSPAVREIPHRAASITILARR